MMGRPFSQVRNLGSRTRPCEMRRRGRSQNVGFSPCSHSCTYTPVRWGTTTRPHRGARTIPSRSAPTRQSQLTKAVCRNPALLRSRRQVYFPSGAAYTCHGRPRPQTPRRGCVVSRPIRRSGSCTRHPPSSHRSRRFTSRLEHEEPPNSVLRVPALGPHCVNAYVISDQHTSMV